MPYGIVHAYEEQVRGYIYRVPSGRDLFRVVTDDELGVNRLLVFPIQK